MSALRPRFPFAQPLLTAVLALSASAWSATATPIIIEEAARSPYALSGAKIEVTVGGTVSRVVGIYEFIYVRVYDSADKRDPMLIDVPVIVRAEDIAPGQVLKLARAQLTIGRLRYQPSDVLLLDHEALPPVPWLPDGARIALISFNVPRQNLKARFKARITYEQPHVPGPDGRELSGYVPMLPDYAQLESVLHFQPDDFVVKFTALPDVQLGRESINAHASIDTTEELVVRPLHRETIMVAVEPRPPAQLEPADQ